MCFIYFRDFRGRGNGRFSNNRGGRSGSYGNSKPQYGENMRKAQYDIDDMEPISKNSYMEHPTISNMSEVSLFYK